MRNGAIRRPGEPSLARPGGFTGRFDFVSSDREDKEEDEDEALDLLGFGSHQYPLRSIPPSALRPTCDRAMRRSLFRKRRTWVSNARPMAWALGAAISHGVVLRIGCGENVDRSEERRVVISG